MQGTETSSGSSTVVPFNFESFGVTVSINSTHQELVDLAVNVAKASLLGEVHPTRKKKFDHRFDLNRSGAGTYTLYRNGERIAGGRSKKKFLKFFDAMIRVTVGESAVDRVFMHAGVVAWNGKAILIPADSFKGKTTLVAELLRRGAVYYSDEFAVLDENGLVYPFARALSMRELANGSYRDFELSPAEIGAEVGREALVVGLVLLTNYVKNSRWSPLILTPGHGVMEMLPFALSLGIKPEFTMKVLNKVASRAIIASGSRSEAKNFAKTLLDFVDKRIN